MLASVLFTACSLFKKSESGKSVSKLENVTWRITELEGKAVPAEIGDRVPSLTFMSGEKRYSAVTGCNGIGGEYKLEKDNKLTFSRGMSTQMWCENMDVERGLGKIIPLIKSYEIQNDRLELKDEASKVLATFVLMP